MFLAHISEDGSRKQTILEHSHGTAELAGKFADSFGCKEWGYCCGLLHDVGKYSQAFERRLKGGPITDHATAGGKELFYKKYIMAAYCVAGHHSGLLDGGSIADTGGEATFYGRMNKTVEDYSAFQQEIKLPVLPNPPLKPLGTAGFSVSFFIRMLFSCLVDADYLDTENFMLNGQVDRGSYDTMETLFDRLQYHVQPWLKNTDITTVNGRRTQILQACLEQGLSDQGLFQLTVPTGGGKTVSALAFALQHAQKHNLNRIVTAIPYTSIIEQNAQIFKDILGKNNVLEDHSNVVFENEDELKREQLAAENWDRPVVVTTNVQFFESLFSNKTSKCRKIHNLAKSVIILDEAQMIPTKYLKPCVRAISELIYNYQCTVVICTATQPSLQRLFPKQIQAKEICPDPKDQYMFFKRTDVINEGELSEQELIRRLEQHSQVLCILNNRKRVQRVYRDLKGEGTYHLSTLMYPEHRKRVLKEIRKRLNDGQPCRVIATSLVEAGVDIDFEFVYRELAGIDSIIQAAGRCNREGKRDSQKCKTTVFTITKDENSSIPMELKLPISVAEKIMRKHQDITSLDAIDDYFNLLYDFKGEGLDAYNIVELFEQGIKSALYPFASVANQFHLIEQQTKPILIDNEADAQRIVQRFRYGEPTRQLVRDAGHYCVNVFEKDFNYLKSIGALEPLSLEIYMLRNKEQYTEDMGLIIDLGKGDALIF